MKWEEIIAPRGEWHSPSYDISNKLGSTYAEFAMEADNPSNQVLEVYYSTSSDESAWTEWIKLENGDTGFMGDITSQELYFRYKVIFSSEKLSNKPYLQSVRFDFSPRLRVENIGDLDTRPKLWITKRNNSGEVRLKNLMTGYELVLSDLNKNEEVFLDGEDEEIVSAHQSLGVYRYDDHNDNWLDLLAGENYIQGEGDFDLDIRMQSRLLND